MDGSLPPNPYLSGNFAPVADEADHELTVTGEIPADLAGAFYRNGPNPQFPPLGQHHWFFGDGMLHGVWVEGGRARYRNRYVRTPKWQAEHKAGRALISIDPRLTEPEGQGVDGGVANTNVVWHGGRLMALEEGHEPMAIDPATLETLGYLKPYGGNVTAHPKIDAATGEMIWFAYSVGAMPFSSRMAYGVTAADGTVLRRDEFDAPYSSMVHDFMVTDRHVMFPVLPLTGSLERAMVGGPPFAWEPEKAAFVGVMARDASVDTIRWFQTDPCYVFHPMNAWEEGSKLFADVMEYPVAPLFPNADGSNPMARPYARLTRWTIDLAGASDTIKREPLDDLAGEFPRFDERRTGLAYRHGWFAANTHRPGSTSFDSVAHIDLGTGARTLWSLPDGDYAGEPVFVPRTAGAEEGDGWLVGLVYRGADDASDFVVLDAQDIAAGPIASARIPRRVPFGFHGNWRQA
jgi:carotenoid cleavage dioxygenase-like enzyme